MRFYEVFKRFIYENEEFKDISVYQKNDDKSVYEFFYHSIKLFTIELEFVKGSFEIVMNSKDVSAMFHTPYNEEIMIEKLNDNFKQEIIHLINSAKLDLNEFFDIIEDDMESFDFEEAQEVMTKLEHTWGCSENVPSVKEIRKFVKDILVRGYTYMVYNNEDYYIISSGGYTVTFHHNEDDYYANIMYAPVDNLVR